MKPDLSFCEIHYDAPIVFITYKEHVELGFNEIRAIIRAAEEQAGHKPYFVLSKVRRGLDLTPMAKKIVSDPKELPLHRGSAVILPNKLLQVAANLFSKLTPTPYPFKAFTEEKKAREWLLTLPLETASR